MSSSMPELIVRPLKVINGREFGAELETVPALTSADFRNAELGAKLRALWIERGVVVIRGLDWLTGEDMAALSSFFGPLEQEVEPGREHAKMDGVPVMRIGNAKGPDGKPNCMPSGDVVFNLPANGNCQYDPDTRKPIWHTDATFRAVPPAGSALFCRQNPPIGGVTCFADMRAAWEALPPAEQKELENFECLCSLSHHDTKIHARRTDYPLPTPALRAANPPRRVPVVLEHPCNGIKSLYGWNSSVACVVQKGQKLDGALIEKLEVSPVEDPSTRVWRELLPRVTAPEFALKWDWLVGDIVIWDNRSTMHCPTGFDHSKYVREMWRTTILPEDDGAVPEPDAKRCRTEATPQP